MTRRQKIDFKQIKERSEYEFTRLVRRLENEKNGKAVTKSTQKTMQGDERHNLTLIKGGRGGSKYDKVEFFFGEGFVFIY